MKAGLLAEMDEGRVRAAWLSAPKFYNRCRAGICSGPVIYSLSGNLLFRSMLGKQDPGLNKEMIMPFRSSNQSIGKTT
jgi:hypothetical protein